MWERGGEGVEGRMGGCWREERSMWEREERSMGEGGGECGREEGGGECVGGRREVCGTMKRSVEKRRGVWKGGGEHMGQRMGRYGKEREGCGTEEGEVWK